MESLRDVSLDFSNWELYKTVEPFRVLGVPIPGLRQLCYQTNLNGTIVSAGVFELKGKQTHVAWGLKNEPHCSFHALGVTAGWSNTVTGCPEYKVLRYDGTISGFSVDGTIFATGVYVPASFSQSFKAKLRQYAPLITLFLLAIVWASVKTYLTPGTPPVIQPVHAAMQMDPSFIDTHAVHEWMLDFMGGFFLLFGMLKAVNVRKFAIAFRNYDIVAKRFKFWGYVYPFIELSLGILYTARLFLPAVYVITLVLMTVGCVGIFLKLRKREEVICACLGGFFDLPLSEITFVENLLMANMALMMLLLV